MKRISSDRKRVLSWAVSAGLILAPAVCPLGAKAQQGGSQAAQKAAAASQRPNWGPAGPPPDAQNGQLPPPPPADPVDPAQGVSQPPNNGEGNGVQTQGVAQPSASQSAAPQPGQAGQWGPAGPPPDVQNGEVPPPPPDDDQYQDQDQGQYQGQDQGQDNGGQYSYGNQAPAPLSGPVVVPAGTLFHVLTSEPLDTKKLHPGDYFQATVAQSVFRGNVLAIPRGAQVVGRVVDVRKAGDLKGSAGFTLQLVSLNLGGQSIPLATNAWSMQGPGKGRYSAGNTVGTAVLGAVIGAIAGGGPGAAIGAVAGTGVGLGTSAATPGPRGVIPPEAAITFHLVQPATVQPVSYQEAQQLEQNLPSRRPMYRGQYAYPAPGGSGYYAPGPYAAPYAYAYPYGYGYPYGGYYRYRYRRWR